MKRLLQVVLLSFFISACGKEEKPRQAGVLPSAVALPYRLDQPSQIRELPDLLREVSGITDLDSALVACVQDELGLIFIYNHRADSLEGVLRFDDPGDYEGLTLAQGSLFILRSDGRLTEWSEFKPESGGHRLSHLNLHLLTADNEGLCYDSAGSRLLIAGKSKPLQADQKSFRYIYALLLPERTLLPEPAYVLSLPRLESLSVKLKLPPPGLTSKGNPRNFNFRPSSIAVHPLTQEIYVLSAEDRLLLRMDRKGNPLGLNPLDETLFVKPEGLTFLADGTLIITNEGSGKTATLMVFPMQK